MYVKADGARVTSFAPCLKAFAGGAEFGTAGGWTSSTQLTHQLENAWFQLLNLKCDILVSTFAFTVDPSA